MSMEEGNKEEMNPVGMEPESIYEKLKELKTNWVKNTNKKQNEIEEQKEVREFVSENQKYLTILKSQYPEEFERFYWDILVCVKRKNIFQNTVYSKMLPVVTLCISILSMMLSVANFFPDNVGLKIALTVVSSIAGLISLAMFKKFIWFAMNTREFSYYEIMLALLEDLRNGEEETLTEEQSSRYVVTLQSCDRQEEDRPANTYDVTVQQRK